MVRLVCVACGATVGGKAYGAVARVLQLMQQVMGELQRLRKMVQWAMLSLVRSMVRVMVPLVMPMAGGGAAGDAVGDGDAGDVDGEGVVGDVTGDGDASDSNCEGVACDATCGGCEGAPGDAPGNGLVMPMAWMLRLL